MKRIHEFLKESKVFYMATVDGNQPKLRPLGAQFYVDEKIVFGVGDFKEVYRQMQENPLVEIVACKGGKWLRYTGKAVFESDPKYAQINLEEMPGLKKVYNEQTGNKLMMFHLEDAKAVIHSVNGDVETIL